MRRLILMAFSISMLFSLSAYANSKADSIDNSHLKLCNSTEVNIIFILDVGSADLYLPNCEILDYSEFMLAITYNRPFTAEEFIISTDELVSRNISDIAYKNIKKDLDLFNSRYQGVEKGDEYRVSYTLKNGLSLEKNGQLISSSNNKDLAKAYFKVWFGEKPFHKRMKKNLLKNINILPEEKSAI